MLKSFKDLIVLFHNSMTNSKDINKINQINLENSEDVVVGIQTQGRKKMESRDESSEL